MSGDKNNIREFTFSLITIGEGAVGKTSLIKAFSDPKAKNSKHIATIGLDYKEKRVTIDDNTTVLLKIWDTAGQERFKTITPSLFNKCQGFILVYDITKIETFNRMQFWIEQIYEKVNKEEIAMILIGNKSDLDDEREVFEEMVESISKVYNIQFFETSAYTNQNVNEAFMYITKKLIMMKDGIEGEVTISKKNSNKNIQIKQSKEQKKKCCFL